MGIVQVKNTLQELKLHGMYDRLDKVLEDRDDTSSLVELLEDLVQAEFDTRIEKQTISIMKRSKLDEKPQLEDFDFIKGRTISKSQIKDLYELTWVKNNRSIVIDGPTGVGKTFLAKALGTRCCVNRITTLYIDMSRFLEELNIARSTNSYLKFLGRLSRPQVLILDDFGLRKLSADQANDLCDLLKARVEKSTIVTTQLPVSHWQEVIEDPVIADTLIDRMSHTPIQLHYEGPTYREVIGKKLDKKMGSK